MTPTMKNELESLAKRIDAVLSVAGRRDVSVALGYVDEKGDLYCKAVGEGGVSFTVRETQNYAI
jgi:hypothetical protein